MRLSPARISRCLRVLARIACLTLGQLLLLSHTAAAQLAFVEVDDVRIVYVDGSESYLVPYAARTFLNSLRFQKKLFDFTPYEKITIVLVDFQDSGGASTTT